jgi:hypothetical protein
LEELPYDFVVRGIDSSQSFKTVQVKQSYPYGKNNLERCDIRKRCGAKKGKTKYADGDFDYLAAFNPSMKQWYVIPWKEIESVKSEINLSSERWKAYAVTGGSP